ncbi:coiled-coil domain-containing protein [Enterococcus mundtii]|uniref:coiled-coil domain-containing protein n=1 Tax=Enterococcus mundtii TaxID=53346 RepID=UPI0032DFEEF6
MKKRKQTRPRFKKRRKYIKWLGILGILSFLILGSPIYTHKSINIPDEVSTNPFLSGKEMKLVEKEKGKNQELVCEFAIENEDQNLLKELTNLTYQVEVKTAKGDYQEIQTKLIPVSKDYLVVQMTHMPEEYAAIRITIKANKIDSQVDMQVPKDLVYYVHQDKVTKELTDHDYAQHAVDYKVKDYQQEVKKAQENIDALQASIELNENLISELTEQLTYQVDEDQEATEQKISNYQEENETSKTQIKEEQETIKKLQEKITHVTKETL